MTGLIPLLLLLPALAATSGAAAEEGADDESPYPGQPGAVQATEGGYVGEFTAGSLPDRESVLADFSVGGVPVFASIDLTGWEQTDADVEEATVEVHGTTGQLKVYDARAAYLSIEFESGQTLTVVPAEGASLVLGQEGSARITNGAFSGLLWSDCEGRSLVLREGRAVLGPADGSCKLRFRADTQMHPIGSTELQQAIASGRLAAEVTVEGDGQYALTHVESFEAVEVQVHATDGHVVVAVSGTAEGPRSVIILLPPQVLPAGDTVEATMDGKPAFETDAQGALAAASTTNASYARVSSSGLAAIVLSIPSFSLHIFEFMAAGAVLPPLAGGQPISLGEAAGPLALGSAAAIGAGAALLRRPREE